MIFLEPRPAQTIDDFCRELVAHAWLENDTVIGEYAERTLEAYPGSTSEEVMSQWQAMSHRSYSGGAAFGGGANDNDLD